MENASEINETYLRIQWEKNALLEKKNEAQKKFFTRGSIKGRVR